VSARLASSIKNAKHLDRFPATRAYFFDAAGAPLAQGATRDNPAFAETLRVIARDGVDAFYSGGIATDIVDAVNATSNVQSNITLADLAGYRAKLRAPVCHAYRVYEVCGMGPPTSGGLTVGQILGMLTHFDVGALGWGAQAAHLLAEAEKLAYADRGRYMADSDYVQVPVRGLLNTEYLRMRAAMIDPTQAGPAREPGVPPGAGTLQLASSVNPDIAGTSHFVVRDAYGNALSMTTTIESGFGSRVFVRGFLLNNELTDFDRQPQRDGRLVANRVEGGKRPRSSMSPTIVLRDGKPALLIGSPGGSRIIGYVAQALVGVLDLSMTPQAAIDMGHVVHRNGKALEVEEDTDAAGLGDQLTAMGHTVKARKLVSGLHAIAIHEGRLEGGADRRREGVVMGE
jgi:gamma-glutamyltranspeptidase/glutathione hydrolase